MIGSRKNIKNRVKTSKESLFTTDKSARFRVGLRCEMSDKMSRANDLEFYTNALLNTNPIFDLRYVFLIDFKNTIIFSSRCRKTRAKSLVFSYICVKKLRSTLKL